LNYPRAGSRTNKVFYPGRTQLHGDMRLCMTSCRTCCPTNDTSPCRSVLHNDRRLGGVSSYPPTTVQRDFVEVAVSRTEEADGVSFSNDCFDGKSTRQGKRVWHFAAAQPTTFNGLRPICGRYFKASVVVMTPSPDLEASGRELCSDRRSTCDRSRRAVLRFLAGSSLRLAHSTAHRRMAVWVSCHSPR
jgi:hypothetical protein